MDGNNFDELTRMLAQAPSRRAFLKVLAGVVAGSMFGLQGSSHPARAFDFSWPHKPGGDRPGDPCTGIGSCTFIDARRKCSTCRDIDPFAACCTPTGCIDCKKCPGGCSKPDGTCGCPPGYTCSSQGSCVLPGTCLRKCEAPDKDGQCKPCSDVGQCCQNGTCVPTGNGCITADPQTQSCTRCSALQMCCAGGKCVENCPDGQACNHGVCDTCASVGQCLYHTSTISICVNTCPDPTTCVGGVCTEPVCSPPCTSGAPDCCNNTCTSKLTDPQNCGTCGHVCTVSGTTCQNGSCLCSDGSAPCNGTTCCASGLSCQGGSCQPNTCNANTCQTGCCNGKICVQQNNQTNLLCGTGGAACAPCSGSCHNGVCDNTCSPTCAGGTPDCCNNACTDKNFDVNNCGTCGHQCRTGYVCGDGICQPPLCNYTNCGSLPRCCPNSLTSNCLCICHGGSKADCAVGICDVHATRCDANGDADCGPNAVCSFQACTFPGVNNGAPVSVCLQKCDPTAPGVCT